MLIQGPQFEIIEWLLADVGKQLSSYSDNRSTISTPVPISHLAYNGKFEDRRRTPKSAKYAEVLVIDTDPNAEIHPLSLQVSNPTKPQTAHKSKLRVKCPMKHCSSPVNSLSKLNAHFQQMHSFKCPYEGCPFTHYNLVCYINHVKDKHNDLDLPTKRPRTLDEQAAEASLGFYKK